MVEYDSHGRMKYNPELHDNWGKAWTQEEEDYLIKWYDLIGLEEMGLALGRTETVVSNKVVKLRKLGIMGYPKIRRCNKRILICEEDKPIIGY